MITGNTSATNPKNKYIDNLHLTGGAAGAEREAIAQKANQLVPIQSTTANNPVSPPAGINTGAPKSDPYQTYLQSMFDPKQLKTAQESVNNLNERISKETLRARNQEDIIKKNEIGQVERGLNYELGENSSKSARTLADLAIAKGASTDIYNQMLNAGKESYTIGTEQERYMRELGQKNLAASAPALLAQLGQLPDQAAKDAYIRSKAEELGVSIDMMNSALQKEIPKETATKFETVTLGSGKTARKVRYGYDASGNIVSAIDLASGQDYSGQGGGLSSPIPVSSGTSRSSSAPSTAKQESRVKQIIALYPGEWGMAADRIDQEFGAGTATKYGALLKKAFAPKSTASKAGNSLADRINAAFQ